MLQNGSSWIDCESYESALASLAGVYGASSKDIKDFLFRFDLDSEYENYKGDMDAGDLLQIKFDQQFGNPKHSVTGISWFHLTRTLEGTTFSEGILPLGAALPKLWDMLVLYSQGWEQETAAGRTESERRAELSVPVESLRQTASRAIRHAR